MRRLEEEVLRGAKESERALDEERNARVSAEDRVGVLETRKAELKQHVAELEEQLERQAAQSRFAALLCYCVSLYFFTHVHYEIEHRINELCRLYCKSFSLTAIAYRAIEKRWSEASNSIAQLEEQLATLSEKGSRELTQAREERDRANLQLKYTSFKMHHLYCKVINTRLSYSSLSLQR